MIIYDYNGYKLNKYPCNGYNDKSKCKDCIHMVCKPENARKYIKEEYGYDVKNTQKVGYILLFFGSLLILLCLFLLIFYSIH